jgi:hypothetical protein
VLKTLFVVCVMRPLELDILIEELRNEPALFVDDPEKFNGLLENFLVALRVLLRLRFMKHPADEFFSTFLGISSRLIERYDEFLI